MVSLIIYFHRTCFNFSFFNSVFSRDVTVTMLVPLNKGIAASNLPAELISFLMQIFPFVLVEKHVRWSRESKHPIRSDDRLLAG